MESRFRACWGAKHEAIRMHSRKKGKEGSRLMGCCSVWFSLDNSEMLEMQGFGANLLSWQLEHCSQGSSCVSCSTGSSPYDIPSCCSCIHDR